MNYRIYKYLPLQYNYITINFHLYTVDLIHEKDVINENFNRSYK